VLAAVIGVLVATGAFLYIRASTSRNKSIVTAGTFGSSNVTLDQEHPYRLLEFDLTAGEAIRVRAIPLDPLLDVGLMIGMEHERLVELITDNPAQFDTWEPFGSDGSSAPSDWAESIIETNFYDIRHEVQQKSPTDPEKAATGPDHGSVNEITGRDSNGTGAGEAMWFIAPTDATYSVVIYSYGSTDYLAEASGTRGNVLTTIEKSDQRVSVIGLDNYLTVVDQSSDSKFFSDMAFYGDLTPPSADTGSASTPTD